MAHIIDTRKNLARESKFKNTHRHRHPFTLLEKMYIIQFHNQGMTCIYIFLYLVSKVFAHFPDTLDCRLWQLMKIIYFGNNCF